MKIVADEKIPFLRGVLEPFAEVIYMPGNKIGNKDIIDADALLIRTRTKCTGELLKNTSVSFIGTATIGFDHIDTQYCEDHKITWTNSPGCNSSSVQQYLAAALLSIASEFNFSLKARTLGIVGVGNVGSRVEKLARSMGMKVLLNDPPRARKEGAGNFVDFDTILQESGIITVHVPLNMAGEDKTYHIFNENSFQKIRNGAWLINTSRGEVVRTDALKKAIASGILGGAILDVWENEPCIDLELMEKVFLSTPHIAGYSTDGKANGTSMVVNSLSNFFNLQLKNWYPDNVPEPSGAQLVINCRGKKDQDILREAVKHTYDIEEDNVRLRLSPSDFEKLRGDYRIRREFPAYNVVLQDAGNSTEKMLREIGFQIVSLPTK